MLICTIVEVDSCISNHFKARHCFKLHVIIYQMYRPDNRLRNPTSICAHSAVCLVISVDGALMWEQRQERVAGGVQALTTTLIMTGPDVRGRDRCPMRQGEMANAMVNGEGVALPYTTICFSTTTVSDTLQTPLHVST